ncbi:hypothetical protein ACWE42_15080 [Sutcliffiella cohnii]|uniref:hypothetical protein n=1 Tax=Sutcliffiella cohnii TaxID=33932 RepID=UPI002E20AEA5|nr:hypothetical protein [Sutcliffiella cohnii]
MISYINQKDDWYKNFFSLSIKEQYDTYISLLDQSVPDDELIRDDFGTIAVDLKSNLINEKKYEEAIFLIEKTKNSTTKFYQKEYPYLSNFAVEYYLYKDDMKNALNHLQGFIDKPHIGYDLFIPLFNKILFYNKHDLALQIAKDIFPQIVHSDDLISGAELELVNMIFFSLFQDYYVALKNGQTPDRQQVEATLKNYDYDDAFFESELPKIHKVLHQIVVSNKKPFFTSEEWKGVTQASLKSTLHDLFWSFAVYMLEEYKIHFSTSYNIWFGFSDFLVRNKTNPDFSFQKHELVKGIDQYFEFMSDKEEEEGFALLWGIPYIYDFLDQQQLVSTQIKEQSLKHVKAVKNRLIKKYEDDVWRFDFVHAWCKPATISSEEFAEEQELFHQSFIKPKIETTKQISKSLESFTPLSIFDDLFKEEVDIRSTKSKQSKAQKKNKRKQAKKQRKKNRK